MPRALDKGLGSQFWRIMHAINRFEVRISGAGAN